MKIINNGLQRKIKKIPESFEYKTCIGCEIAAAVSRANNSKTINEFAKIQTDSIEPRSHRNRHFYRWFTWKPLSQSDGSWSLRKEEYAANRF